MDGEAARPVEALVTVWTAVSALAVLRGARARTRLPASERSGRRGHVGCTRCVAVPRLPSTRSARRDLRLIPEGMSHGRGFVVNPSGTRIRSPRRGIEAEAVLPMGISRLVLLLHVRPGPRVLHRGDDFVCGASEAGTGVRAHA